MRIFAGNPYGELTLWMCMAVLSILLFFFAATNLILLLIQKRYKWLWLAAPVLCLSYFLEQCFDMALSDSARTTSVRSIVARFAALGLAAYHALPCSGCCPVPALLEHPPL